MNFNAHSDLKDLHSFLSPSNYHWVNYTPEKLESVYRNHKAKEEGTMLHEFASTAIKKRIKLAPLKKALNMFVNDAIGYKMQSEQVLYYSNNAFGTADAILFKDNLLRIHDLKTGFSKPSFKQLFIYCALFCLEYGFKPHDISMEVRLYQGTMCDICVPDPDEIADIMDKIREFDIILENIKYNM